MYINRDLIKLIFLIKYSRTILSETEFLISLQQVYGDEEYNISTFEGYCLVLSYFTSSFFHHCYYTINEIITQ